MPDIKTGVIPGKEGTDYNFVRHGDQVYVVYKVKLPNGKWVNTSWKVKKEDYEALGVQLGKIGRVGRAQFQSLNIFGDSSEIVNTSKEEHPFQQYLKELRERYGASVSWFDNKEFMSTMLMGWAENWSAAELEQRIKRTKWYQTRTDAERNWELEMSKAEKSKSKELWQTRAMDSLDDLWGTVDWRDRYKTKDLKQMAERIASGRLGSPDAGFEIWMRNQRLKAEKVEGTQAWIERQREEEEQRGFMNRPEDMREQIRTQAFEWLGPRGMPDNETMRKWSEELVSEVKSEGDWQKFLRNQAQNLYPWLGTDERWQDRAGVYKRIVEENWGKPITWDNKMLYELGETRDNGEFTGKALAYDAFERQVRSKRQFWEGPVAKEEGFELFNQLNTVFNGVTA